MEPKWVYKFYLYISQGSVEITASLVRGSGCPCDYFEPLGCTISPEALWHGHKPTRKPLTLLHPVALSQPDGSHFSPKLPENSGTAMVGLHVF